MSHAIALTLRVGPPHYALADAITPDRLAGLSRSEIAASPLALTPAAARELPGTRAMGTERRARGPTIGELFDVATESGDNAATVSVRVVGDVGRLDALGAGMTSGTLIVDGNVGRDLGRGMIGGLIEVRGSVGHGAGRAMAGGTISVSGSAGDAIGGPLPGGSRGMTGGQILVHGDAGRDAGFCARRGLVVIAGNADDGCARAMIAGTVVVIGRAAGSVGPWNKRGTVVVLGGAEIPDTYRYACTYRPPYLQLLFAHLRRTSQISVDERFVAGRYARYCGDLSELGRGELLTLASA